MTMKFSRKTAPDKKPKWKLQRNYILQAKNMLDTYDMDQFCSSVDSPSNEYSFNG